MSKTITLPEGRYRVTKAKAVDPKSWMIQEGDAVIGVYEPTITVGEGFFAQGQGVRDYITTSLVRDFKLLPNNVVEIHTLNSIYILEEIS